MYLGFFAALVLKTARFLSHFETLYIRCTLGDSLLKQNNCSFSTFDNDNDKWLGNCAMVRHGGWWYNRCCYSNLNGKYYLHARIDFAGMIWFSWKKSAQALKGVVMKIQPNQITPQEMVL